MQGFWQPEDLLKKNGKNLTNENVAKHLLSPKSVVQLHSYRGQTFQLFCG